MCIRDSVDSLSDIGCNPYNAGWQQNMDAVLPPIILVQIEMCIRDRLVVLPNRFFRYAQHNGALVLLDFQQTVPGKDLKGDVYKRQVYILLPNNSRRISPILDFPSPPFPTISSIFCALVTGSRQ